MLRKIASLFCLSLLFVVPVVAAADAAATYKGKCAACHAADGSGNTTMGKKLGLRSLGSADVQKQTDKELTTIVAKGKGKMPGYSGKIPDAEISALVKYIRSFATK